MVHGAKFQSHAIGAIFMLTYKMAALKEKKKSNIFVTELKLQLTCLGYTLLMVLALCILHITTSRTAQEQ